MLGPVRVVSEIMRPEYPVVRVTVGQSISEVRKRSTQPFSLKGREDDSPFVVETPVLLEYGQGTDGFSLPPGSYLWISQLGGRVHEVQFSPHLEALTWEQAIQLCFALLDRFDSSHWRPERATNPSARELREDLDASTLESYTISVQRWSGDSSRMYLTLGRLRRPEEPGETEAFAVTLTVNDRRLRDELWTQVETKRASHGSPDDALPLEEWLKDKN